MLLNNSQKTCGPLPTPSDAMVTLAGCPGIGDEFVNDNASCGTTRLHCTHVPDSPAPIYPHTDETLAKHAQPSISAIAHC